MANQSYVGILIQVLGDGSSTTATIVLDSTPFYTSHVNISNFNPQPSSVSTPVVFSQTSGNIPASATLSKNGKQVLITFSSAFTGSATITFNLGYLV